MNIKGECQHCGESVEMTVSKPSPGLLCPHCGKQLFATPEEAKPQERQPEKLGQDLPPGYPKIGEKTSKQSDGGLGWAGVLIAFVLVLVVILVMPYASERGGLVLVLAIPGLLFYFFPSIVGSRKRNAGAIFVLNLFLGWTLIGWVVALVWACTQDSEKSK